MNNEIRLSLSAAREDDGQPLCVATEGSLNQLPTKHRKGWTPAPTKPTYSQTNVSLEHKGRDYDAILRAAKRKPVGYWEDAPMGIKFGGQPLPSASTKPHGKDVDTADGEYEPVGTMPVAGDVVRWGSGLVKVSRIDSTREFSVRFNKPDGGEDGLLMSYFGRTNYDPLRILKRKPTVQTVAVRAWKCTDGWLRCNVGANSFMRHPHMAWVRQTLFDADGVVQLITGNIDYTELHGPERDAIIAECCAAMKLDPMTGEPLHA